MQSRSEETTGACMIMLKRISSQCSHKSAEDYKWQVAGMSA